MNYTIFDEKDNFDEINKLQYILDQINRFDMKVEEAEIVLWYPKAKNIRDV